MHILLSAAALILTGPATQEVGAEPAPMTAPMTVEETFAKMDTDASGGVDELEFVAFAGEGSETQFGVIAGDDGTITLEELASYMDELAGEPEADSETVTDY